MTRARGVRLASMAATAAVLLGCSTPSLDNSKLNTRATAAVAEDAANVYVAALPAVAWSDISDALQPKIGLSMTDARQMAVRATQSQLDQVYSAIGFGLAIAAPTIAKTVTSTITNGTPQDTTTKTKSAGTPPTQSGAASVDDTKGPSPDFTKMPNQSTVDGLTELMGGTALYQQAAILDNQISKQILPRGYQAHLITFQINLQPRQNDDAYNVYVDINLVPANWGEATATSKDVSGGADGLPPVLLYPLIISDALEATSVGRSVQALRQAQVSLTGTVAMLGLNAAYNNGSDKANSIVGSDKNSLVTAGMVNGHTMRVRLGAHNSGTAGQAMVAQSYNVSTMVLTRWGANADDKVHRLSVITHSSVEGVNATSASPALGSSRSRNGLVASVCDKLWTYYPPAAINKGCPKVDWRKPHALENELKAIDNLDQDETKAAEKKDTILNLLRANDRGDYASINTFLDITSLDANEAVKLQRFLVDLTAVQVTSRFSTMVVPLREKDDKDMTATALPVAGQLATLLDDEKSTSTIEVLGGKGLTPETVSAVLLLHQKAKTDPVMLLPTRIGLTDDGTKIDVTFASLKALGLKLSDLDPQPLKLTLTSPSGRTSTTQYAVRSITVPKANAATPAATKPANPVSVAKAAMTLKPDDKKTVHLAVKVGALPDGVKGPNLKVTVKGATAQHDDKDDKSAAVADGAFVVAPSSSPVLVLGDIDAKTSAKVTLTTLGTVNGKADAPIGTAITLTVAAAKAAGDKKDNPPE